jgi:hypothetical protein
MDSHSLFERSKESFDGAYYDQQELRQLLIIFL